METGNASKRDEAVSAEYDGSDAIEDLEHTVVVRRKQSLINRWHF